MFQIILAPKSSNANASMSYKTKESAEASFKNIQDIQKSGSGMLKVTDDFGYILTMRIEDLCYPLMIDVAASQAVVMERALAVNAGQEECGRDPRSASLMGLGQDNMPQGNRFKMPN